MRPQLIFMIPAASCQEDWYRARIEPPAKFFASAVPITWVLLWPVNPSTSRSDSLAVTSLRKDSVQRFPCSRTELSLRGADISSLSSAVFFFFLFSSLVSRGAWWLGIPAPHGFLQHVPSSSLQPVFRRTRGLLFPAAGRRWLLPGVSQPQALPPPRSNWGPVRPAASLLLTWTQNRRPSSG